MRNKSAPPRVRGSPAALGEDVHAVCVLVSHASSEVRYAVAFCLGGRDEALASQTLERLSRDEDADSRNWATFGLGTLSKADTPALRDALLERLADDADVRAEAMRGLALRRDLRVARAILNELQGPDVSDLAIEAAPPRSVARGEAPGRTRSSCGRGMPTDCGLTARCPRRPPVGS